MGRVGGGFSSSNTYEKNIETMMRCLLIATLLLSGCSGILETVALSTTANLLSEVVMEEIRGDCGQAD